MKTLGTLLLSGLLGYGVGVWLSPSVDAQQAAAFSIRGSDSVSNLPVSITTDGANALKVIGK